MIALGAAVLALGALHLAQTARPGREVACARCGAVGAAVRHTRGSGVVEALLWLCGLAAWVLYGWAALAPALLYGAWRVIRRRETCGACGSADVVPAATPRGRRIAAGDRGD